LTDEDPVPVVIVAGVMSASANEWDPPMVEAMEASDHRAILAVLAEGHGVHASDLILARKSAGLQCILRARESGASIQALLEMIARGGPPWTA
jgi:hypothetical protein